MKKNIGYWKNVTCRICGSDKTYIDSSGRYDWRRYRKKGIWDGKSYICGNCYHKNKTKCRNKKLDKNTGIGKSIISQAIVKKVIGAIDCTIVMNNCNYPIDIFETDKYGKIDVKYSALDIEKNDWYFATKGKTDADMYFCLGFSIDRRNIEKVWIIPNEDWVVHLKGLSISKNSCVINTYRYNKYEVNPKPYNDVYHNLDIKNCPYLKEDEEHD